ncbi:DNA-directed RNA polymerase subunit alpha C-terminal domain-containing protein [Haliangium sp. UPWRP_2]|uniref:DNA-directed RNA polymerase subunit alpha C-terminal domain-containing protein n=1 Tax=Haliangium sp. UPWRP_2 TaxID=1931276 RepID=UPI000B5393B3|nr:DNA-directed RNA polymerase subunit alpha C-terminal domain-containing protein [Haliangium sp. UPWRP_2]PSM31585.1 hypothetical protein BVG81_004660 [Haliangium sp. UPWRP_2]
MTHKDPASDDYFRAIRERREQQRREPVEVLKISPRVRQLLRELGVNTLGDLERLTEVKLLDIRGIGQTTIRSLRAEMSDRGLALSGRLRDD